MRPPCTAIAATPFGSQPASSFATWRLESTRRAVDHAGDRRRAMQFVDSTLDGDKEALGTAFTCRHRAVRDRVTDGAFHEVRLDAVADQTDRRFDEHGQATRQEIAARARGPRRARGKSALLLLLA